MSTSTITHLRLALADDKVVTRYWSHVVRNGTAGTCWLWTGAIAGRGHGRFQIGAEYTTDSTSGERRRRTYVAIAHRFGFALTYGIDALLATPLVSHRCDNPLCQLPDHWRASNVRDNTRSYAYRRDIVRGALSDTRGARGRSRAIRDAARAGADVSEAVLAGWRPVDRDQLPLLPESSSWNIDA